MPEAKFNTKVFREGIRWKVFNEVKNLLNLYQNTNLPGAKNRCAFVILTP